MKIETTETIANIPHVSLAGDVLKYVAEQYIGD